MLYAGAALAVPVWTWVDADGQRHYADRPVKGATRIELQEAPTIGGTAAPAESGSETSSSAQPEQAEPYREFNIVAPSQQQTLWNIGAMLDVQVELSPPLQPGHHLDVYLDGQLVNIGATAPQFTVPDVYRGVHTLQAVVRDRNGDEVLRSLAVTFMVQQTSILNPNNPNAPGRRSGQN